MGIKQSRRGFRDWLIQRTTAILIGVYAVAIVIYLLAQQPIDAMQWQTLYGYWWMKLATLVVLISILWHAWIGLWTIFTDYVHHNVVRTILLLLVLLLLVAYLAWTIAILWGHG